MTVASAVLLVTGLGSAASAADAGTVAPAAQDVADPAESDYPANWPDLEPYGTADGRSELMAREDNSLILDLELRPQDEELGRVWMRDTYVNRFEVDGESLYVATGTTRAEGLDKAAPWNDGLYIWTAPALDGPWTLVDTTGLRPDEPKGKVWSPEFADENTADRTVVADWQTYTNPDDPATRQGQVWAPELQYIDGKWYLVACIGDAGKIVGSFGLVSEGGIEGPYRNIAETVDKPFGDPVRATDQRRYHIDGGMFHEDDDTYLVLHNDYYAKFTDDMEHLETSTDLPTFDQQKYQPEPYIEGATVTKYEGKYYLMHAIWSNTTGTAGDPSWSYLGGTGPKDQYDAVVAVSDSFEGPYSPRYTAGVGAGHNNMFVDDEGAAWMTFFRNLNKGFWSDPSVIEDSAVPGVVRLEWTGPEGDRLYAQRPQADAPLYDPMATYTEGDRVTYEGRTFEAQWWVRGQTPGASPWGGWSEVGSPSTCGTQWTTSAVYDEGDVVAHDGSRWRASWWTRNQEPARPRTGRGCRKGPADRLAGHLSGPLSGDRLGARALGVRAPRRAACELSGGAVPRAG
ncbi:hypothetical protein GCM10025865_12020 [Paraoerskovia sediminicola]|uniref:Chitin-binding type-3 domain-containing protein n=1 Tax=Paraoerskovia sediminicola TaxID=1138587 RepID=A0ABM8G1H6_9CELL|nr:family 43 glycosylhydrolase [Paraoerskovia sediminicola]BDZ41903.1 hypothetical protein GCM10025865_12020 [Paraoerskovia sediminicola]